MCQEDVKIMREMLSNEVPLDLTTGSVQAIPRDLNRVGLIFGPPDTGDLWVSTRSGHAVGDGILVNATVGALQLSGWDHGELVRSAWFVIHSAGGETSSVFTTSLHQDK